MPLTFKVGPWGRNVSGDFGMRWCVGLDFWNPYQKLCPESLIRGNDFQNMGLQSANSIWSNSLEIEGLFWLSNIFSPILKGVDPDTAWPFLYASFLGAHRLCHMRWNGLWMGLNTILTWRCLFGFGHQQCLEQIGLRKCHLLWYPWNFFPQDNFGHQQTRLLFKP